MTIINCTAKPLEISGGNILPPGEKLELPPSGGFDLININGEEGSVNISIQYGMPDYRCYGKYCVEKINGMVAIQYYQDPIDFTKLTNKGMFTTLTANEDLYVRVKDINECLKDDSWNKDDEIHDYAVGLIDWCINKRAVDFETLCKMEGYTVPKKIGENDEED